MHVPANPRIYHVIHVDRLSSVVADGFVWSDAEMSLRQSAATMIGMSNIKARRLNELRLDSHPDLFVGQCTPFYFCPRSIMLYLIYRRNEELAYKGGQEPIIHLEADLMAAIDWADKNNTRWAFTLSNAGAYYFEDRSDVESLNEIDWNAVHARNWSGNGVQQSIKEGKQAEFLLERAFPWHLVERIGVFSREYVAPVSNSIPSGRHRPRIEIMSDWYY